MEKFILVLSTGKIHNGLNPCGHCKKSKTSSRKYFDNFSDAENYYEGKTKKGEACSFCLKDYREE